VRSLAPRILSAFKLNLETATIKQNTIFFTATGGSGAGKTRAATETTRILSKVEGFQNIQEIYVDFSNGNEVNPFEKEDPDNILGSRIFVAALRNGTKISKLDSEEKLYRYYFDQRVFKTSLVLKVVSVKFREWLNLDKDTPLPVTLILDELQQTIPSVPAWKRIIYTVADYMCDTSSFNRNTIDSKLIVVPVLAGTLLDRDIRFAPTSYHTEPLPLPSFEPESVKLILNNMGIDKRLLMGREMTRLWYHMGLVPRNLEDAFMIAKQALKEYDDVHDLMDDRFHEMVQYIYRETRELLFSRYRYYENEGYSADDERLLFHALSAKVPGVEEGWLVAAISEGKVFKTSSGFLFLPYFVFESLVDRYYRSIHRLLPLDGTVFGWSHLEQLDMKTLAIRINGIIRLLNNKRISLRELFPGVKGENSSYRIDIQPVQYVEALEEFGGVDKNTGKYVHKSPQDTIFVGRSIVMLPEDRVKYVMRCAPSNKGFDGFFFAKAEEKDVIFCIQYKFKPNPNPHGSDTPSLGPNEWYNKVAKGIKDLYPNHDCFFVYITNAKLTDTIIDNAISKNEDLLIVGGNNFYHYVSPNILPYYREITDFDQ
jgi:hypothetical protein